LELNLGLLMFIIKWRPNFYNVYFYFRALKGKFENSPVYTFLTNSIKLSALYGSSLKKMYINLRFPLGRHHLLCYAEFKAVLIYTPVYNFYK